MMGTEKKPENDEDEDVKKEAEDSRIVSSQDVECRPLSDLVVNSSENSASKRALSESSSGVFVAEDGNKHASKRMKFSEAEPCRSEEQGVCGLSEVEVPSGEMVKASFLNDCSEGDTCPPTSFSLLCSSGPTDTVSLKTDTEKMIAQEMVSLDPETKSFSSKEVVSVGCTIGNIDSAFRCNMCDHLFSSCSDLEKHAECHEPPSKESAHCPCSHGAESSPALQTHATQTHGSRTVFSCDLCGFQCVEENLLNAHCLGKTHLRRQNLAARGGFVQILTKQPFPKKSCTIGTKSVRIKPRASKQIAKNSDSKGLRHGESKFKDFRGSISKQSGSSSELLVEMRPSRSTVLEKGEIVEENVPSFGTTRNPENQSKKLGALVGSQGLLDKLESTKKTLQTAHGISSTSRPRPERNILMLANSFRRRSGTFPLKSQAKKRFNLLGINKRGTSETPRMYMKHVRAQMKTGDSESMPKHIEMGGSTHSLCVSSSETLDLKQDERNAHHVSYFDPSTVRAASDRQMSCSCTDCGQVSTSRTELEVHMKRCHARDVKLFCQTCDVSSMSRRDQHEHLHNHQLQQTASVLNCQCCSFISLNETHLRDHMKEKHSMGFLCSPCNLFFLSEKEMEEHKTTEKHIRLLVQPKTSQSFNNDLVLQTLPLRTLESENTKDSMSQLGRVAQEELTKTRVSYGSEVRHSNKPQFQCKKCFYKTRSSTVLTRHIKLRHGQDYHFLCKACNLYSLSKEGMEKHIKRSKHLENARKNNIGLSFEECIERVCIGANDKKEDVTISANERTEGDIEDGEAGSHAIDEKEQVTLEPEALVQQREVCSQRGALSTSDNKCAHCEFSAHSSASLELHVKRKHTKEFAFYCMACDYYAVTHREMTRHAATEKHKVKRQSHLNSSDVGASPSEMSKNIIIPEEQHQQNSEEFQIISGQSPETLKSRNATGHSVLDENTNLDMSKVLCVPDSIEVETEEDSNLSEGPPFCETLQQPLAKDKVRRLEEEVTLNISSNGSPSKFQNENSGSSALIYETTKTNHNKLNDIGDPTAHGDSDGGNGGDHEGEILSKHGCLGVLDGAHSVESTVPVVMRMMEGQLNLDSRGQDQVGNMQSSVDLKTMQGDSILENKEILMNSQQETEIVIEEDGPASDSTVESNDVYETIINVDDKGQAMYSFGRFDSSIIRIRNSEDGELIDQCEEGLITTEVRMSESPLKDCAQGVKKKKSEGSSFGESTRIRCDDCGFLADGLSGLNVHIAMKHPTKEKHFHCLLCGKSFYTESNLHQHLASAGHMRNEQASVEELPEGGATFKCVKCTEPFDSEQNLFLHIKGQHEELLREVNKYIVEDTEQINREREENQGNVCKYCGKMCRSSNSMAFLAHIRTHTGSKPFKCKICHFATAQLGDARNHVKRHLGMREYKCHVCGGCGCCPHGLIQQCTE
uniref:Zinc finger protein 407 n=1 Tax=Pipistrellus kuhlii TaxID=59472 RepID=A0A7J7YBJ2_PIPKU|nr:zinc finger protein 407 [Pipistrellus kuhlii]